MIINFWAGARAAAGTASQSVDATTVADALAQLVAQRDDERFARVLRSSSLLVDGVTVSGAELEAPLAAGVVVEVLPPFAGG